MTQGQDKELREALEYLVGSPSNITLEETLQLITADRERVALEARINERNKIALDNYRGKTVSESTNWQAKFEYFVDSNEKHITELKAKQEEVK